jgi:RimJ/RimL family protein N-acetyltransferase
MSGARDLASHIITRGERVILRRWLASDVDQFIYWLSHGEWRLLDAPWHGYRTVTTTEQEKRDREWFTQQLNDGEESWLGKRAVIATLEGIPLGWVNRYGKKKPHVCYAGIDICEDAYLNRGFGTEALRLWIDYLFAGSDRHKLGLDTWSFNPRMIRVAEKVGFVLEGRERALRQWQGEWLDLLHFGMLREEWQGSG